MLAKLTEDFEKISTRLLLFQGLIYVSEHQQNNIIKIYHDDLLSGHQEVYKIIKVIS